MHLYDFIEARKKYTITVYLLDQEIGRLSTISEWDMVIVPTMAVIQKHLNRHIINWDPLGVQNIEFMMLNGTLSRTDLMAMEKSHPLLSEIKVEVDIENSQEK